MSKNEANLSISIGVNWVAETLNISLDKAKKVVDTLYESEYFHDHIVEHLVEALEQVDEK